MDNKALTIDEPMAPLNDQQNDFLKSCLDDTRNRLEEEKREERKFYEESISRMRAEMEEMRENHFPKTRLRNSESSTPTRQGISINTHSK
jgi:hypothetical protein